MNENIKSIIAVRHYKKGYHTVKYEFDDSQYGGTGLTMTTAFTNDSLEYIGETKWAYRLTRKYGLTQLQTRSKKNEIEKRNIQEEAKRLLLDDFMRDYSFSPPVSIGFNEEEQKWYGWSHRAIYGFGIGSKVKQGDCAYQPFDPDDTIDDMKRFWDIGIWRECETPDKKCRSNLIREEKEVPDPHGEREGIGCLIEYETEYNFEGREGHNSTHWEPYPEVWGKGAWTAETIEEAKQIASAFAAGVS